MTTVLLSLGSNVQPRRHLHAAVAALRERFGALQVSPAYRTAAVGFDGPAFLNNGVLIQTDLPLQALDDWLHALEDAHGRDRSGPRFGNRPLDIDIVLYDDLVLEGAGHPGSGPGQVLQLPRDELRHAFALMPLAQVAPDAIEPRSGRTLRALWAAHPQHADAFEAVPL